MTGVFDGKLFPNSANHLPNALGNFMTDAFVITNKTLAGLYYKKIELSLKKSGISANTELVPDSEKAKSQKSLIEVLNRLASYDKNKAVFIIALGGGVVGDLAGFAASIYKRGIPYVQIPTTLLAQVDSAIGGKVAIDLPAAKNLAGSFYQPKIAISDPALLNSLPAREIRNGLAEIIKYGVIRDKILFEYIEKNYKKIMQLVPEALERVILSCSKIKAQIVEEDELDRKGKRAILNYGHTIGHAIEAASSYSGRYNHGEAVAIGMIVAADISAKMGFLKDNDRARIDSLIKKCGLPTKVQNLKISAIYNAHLHDKKFTRGKNKFILPTGIGSVKVVENVPNSIITKSINRRMLCTH